MEEEKEGDPLAASSRKRQREVLVRGRYVLPAGPPVDFKSRLAQPLPEALIVIGEGASSQSHGLPIVKATAMRSKDEIMDYLAELKSCNMQLPNRPSRVSPIDSEASQNADMQACLFELLNFVFVQLDDPYFSRFSICLNPLKVDSVKRTEALSRIWHNTAADGSEGNRPDNLLLEVWDVNGQYDIKPNSLVRFEGKHVEVFTQGFDEDSICSGRLDIGRNWKKLNANARHAVEQLAKYLVDDGLTRGILYTRMVMWEVRVDNPDPKNLTVAIGELITASDTNPSMAEACFAICHERIAHEKEKLAEKKEESTAEGSSASTGLPLGGLADIDTGFVQGAGLSFEGSMPSLSMSEGPNVERKGDELLRNLIDTEPPLHGNSLVRIGRLQGVKVAAKIIDSTRDPRIQQELENESKCFEALKSLQGNVIPEKVFAGRINGGQDGLLVTKYVEGSRLDKTRVNEEIAASARSALQEIHKKGYIHGDVMPRNIVVQNAGKCIFVDLGQTRRAKFRREKQTELYELEAALRSFPRR